MACSYDYPHLIREFLSGTDACPGGLLPSMGTATAVSYYLLGTMLTPSLSTLLASVEESL